MIGEFLLSHSPTISLFMHSFVSDQRSCLIWWGATYTSYVVVLIKDNSLIKVNTFNIAS